MAIKKADAPAADGGDGKLLFRNIVPLELEEKVTDKGKKFWRIKDDKGWYTSWVEKIAERLDAANDAGEQVLVAVDVQKKGKYTNFIIVAVDDEAARLQAAQPKGGGGGGHGGGGGMSEADKLRVTQLALMKDATALAIAEAEITKPKDDVATFLRAKVAEYRSFLEVVLETATKAPMQKPGEEPPDEQLEMDAATLAAEKEEDDIPF